VTASSRGLSSFDSRLSHARDELTTTMTSLVTQEMTFYGVQRRDVTCRHLCDADSTSPSPDDACRRSSDGGGGRAPPASERLCRLPCPLDCVVTELGPWSACCSRLQSRSRRVLAGRRHGGRPCRAPMYETRRCDVDDDEEACGAELAAVRRRPVYRVGRWSDCEELRHHHPVGRRRRSVTCLDELGRQTQLR